MQDRPRKPLFPNPFYVALLAASTLFVVTALAWLAVPSVLDRTAGGRGAAPDLARWVDRHGTVSLGVEFLVMLAAGLLAMTTDRWFPERPDRKAKGDL